MANGSKLPVSSIGTKISIAFESVAGTKPTTDYELIPMITSMPDGLSSDPDTIDTTSFDNLKNRSSIEGLTDLSAIMSLESNYSDYGDNLWNEYVDKQKSKENTDGKVCWLFIDNPSIKKKWFIPINPITTGVAQMALNDRVIQNYRFTIVRDIEVDEIEDTSTYYKQSL